MSEPHSHATHPAIVKRLKRAGGHLSKVVQMIEGGRPCLDVATQLQAVESAIAQAKQPLLKDHLDHSLDDAGGNVSKDKRRLIDEFKQISKFL